MGGGRSADEEAVERVVHRWRSARCRYEAGPTGFGLPSSDLARGQLRCRCAGLVPRRSGDRVKTDPRDARKLARLRGRRARADLCPSPELEAAVAADIVEADRVVGLPLAHRCSDLELLSLGEAAVRPVWL